HRHRHDAAQNGGPERSDELLVVPQKENELVPAPGAKPLQVVKDAERALVELTVGDGVLVPFAFQVGDAARQRPVAFNQLRERGRLGHRRRSSLMKRGCRVRRLIWASLSTGPSATKVRRYRRATFATCTSIS